LLLNVREFAAMTGVKPSTVRAWVFRREIEYIKIGRAVRFKRETARKLIDAGTVPARQIAADDVQARKRD